MTKRYFFHPNPNLLLMPVEIKARELEAKVFFASRAVKRGFEVWIGSAREIFQNFEEFPRGVFMAHHLGKGMLPNLPRAINAGMGIVAWDEESLVVKNDEFYVDERVPERNIRRCHRFFTSRQGDRAALIRRYPDLEERLIATGNPRVDILNEQYLSVHDDLRLHTDKKRVMFNSRFAGSNPESSPAADFRRSQIRKFRGNPQAQDFMRGYVDHTDRLFEAFVEMVDQVAGALSDYEIVLRPHPSESAEVWNGLAEKHGNMTVTRLGTATAWSLASDVVIHNGCTTAVEAALLGCNVLAYCPFRSDIYDVRLANDVSEEVETAEKLVERIRALPKPDAEGRATNAQRTRDYLGQLIAGMQNGTLASDLVLDVLERDTNYPSRGIGGLASNSAKRMSILFHRTMMNWGFNQREVERQRKKDAYFKVKFSGLEKSEVEEILLRVGSPDVRVDNVRKDWVRLSYNGAS